MLKIYSHGRVSVQTARSLMTLSVTKTDERSKLESIIISGKNG